MWLKRSKCEFLGKGVESEPVSVESQSQCCKCAASCDLRSPLHTLLRKELNWTWGCEQEEAFVKSKKLLQSSATLVHYDPTEPLILACDASLYGVGAVLSHKMEDGTDRPIGFVSHTLNAAEKNYSQLDKEGLAVIFGLNKFYMYVYGRPFTTVTDHKPLILLFNELREVPQMASPCIQ